MYAPPPQKKPKLTPCGTNSVAKRGINMEKGFTADGIYLKDENGNPEREPTPCDCVIFATGYKQQAGFIDESVVDLSIQREGNDVELFKGCLPASDSLSGLGFVNFVQSYSYLGMIINHIRRSTSCF